MQKRERLEKALAGEKPDRIPVALWRHWPGDDLRASDLVDVTLSFQQQWDFDFVKLCPSQNYAVVDYGVQDAWQGNLDGTRAITRGLLERSLDWTELRRLDPLRGALGQHATAIRLLEQELDPATPFVVTLYSPLTQARLLAGRETVIRTMRTHPDRLKTGLSILTDNTLRFLEAIRKNRVAGVFYETEFAAYDLITEAEYRSFGRPYDLKILGATPSEWWLNTVHLAHRAPMLHLVADYPAQVFSWNDREGLTGLDKSRTWLKGAVCGGLGREHPLHYGMPGEVREQALDAMRSTYGRHFILSAGSPLIVTTPHANIRAARISVQETPANL